MWRRVIGILLGALLLVVLAGWWWLRGPDIEYATLEAKYADSASHFVDVPGGFHVHYREEGLASGPLIVLLHGYGDSFTSWEGWVAALKDKYRLLSVDFPGHGLTRAPAGTVLNGASLADFLDAFAARLNLPKFAVAGNSMGGGVAWQFAVRHPQRVSALILVDAAGYPNDKPPAELPLAFKILRYGWGRWLLAHIDNRALIRAGLKTDVHDKSLITDFVVDRWAEFQRAPGHRDILMAINPAGQTQASAELLAAVKVPTLILWGEVDPLIEPAAAQKFAGAISGSRVITYPNVGHLPQIEIPQRSAADVAAFLSGNTG
jgi:pimeloyl-ACP methyl ester carboxylesterase